MVLGAKRLGYGGGETTRVENRGETTRGETTRGETSWGRNVLLPHQTYSDALKNSFFPRTIPHWNSLHPSVANAQSTEEFRALFI